MRIQSVVLEYHCDITVLRLNIVHDFVTDLKCTTADLLKTCDHTKCCGLSTSRRSYEDDKLFVFDFKVEIFNCLEAVWISFINVR